VRIIGHDQPLMTRQYLCSTNPTKSSQKEQMQAMAQVELKPVSGHTRGVSGCLLLQQVAGSSLD
jgi:hypothetical protein